MADSPEQQTLNHLNWEWYQALPPSLKPDIEAVVLRALISKHSSDLKELTIDACASALSGSSQLREEFINCWRSGSLNSLQPSETLLSLFKSGQDNLKNIDDKGEHADSENLSIHNSNLISVAGDLWQVSYSSNNHREIANWFNAEDQRHIHNEISAKRMENTGENILKTDEFRKWLTDPTSRVLWCPGIPGAGKTVTSSLVVNYLRTMDEDKFFVGMMYFNYRRWDKQTPEYVLSSMARQVYECGGESPPLKALYTACFRTNSRPSIDQLKLAISSSIKCHDTCYLVVDALDEYCKEYNPKKIRDLLDQTLSLGGNVKILVTSRWVGDMEKIFRQMKADNIELMATEEDITKYVEQRLTTFDFDFALPKDFHGQIIDGVKRAAEGSFLMAELHMNAIESQPTLGDLKQTLSTLPRELNAIYKQAMERIQAQSQPRKEMAMKILMWITCSCRPLRLVDLQDVLAFRPGIQATDLDDYRPSTSMITSVCAGLIVIEARTIMITTDQFPIFVHFSTKNFFDYHKEQYFPNANIELLRTCWDYLSLQHCDDELENLVSSCGFNTITMHSLYPFYEHACLYWGLYVDETFPLEGLVRFLQDNTAATWLCLVYILNMPPILSGLSATPRRLRELFTPPVESDIPTSDQEPGVFLALYHAKFEALPLLLKCTSPEQALVTVKARTPFMFAAMHGMTQVMRCMLNAPVTDPNPEPDFPPEVVTILQRLAKPGDPERADEFGRTSLSYAAEGGYTSTIRLLLGLTQVDVNREDLWGRTALSYAAQGGHEDTVDLLLLHGAGVNFRDTWSGLTPLMYATEHVGTSVVNLLLKYGGPQIDITATCTNRGKTALHYAAFYQNEDAARLLLEDERVDIDSRDYSGRTPLSYAAGEGLDAIVTALIKRGDVDLNSRDDYGYTPLMHAAEMGNVSTVYILLQQPTVSIDPRDMHGRSVIWKAAMFEDSSAVFHWFIRESDPKLNAELCEMEEIYAIQLLAVILAYREGVDVLAVDNGGKTLLQSLSSRKERRYDVERLVDALDGELDPTFRMGIWKEYMGRWLAYLFELES